jgi:ABC-type oligopeptide transport system substrate-binding subunit
MLQAAEKVLAYVVRFHESARQRGVREGSGWDDLEKSLRDKLQSVQFEELQAVAATGTWEDAFALASRLAEAYPSADARRKLAEQLAPFVERSFQDKNYPEVRLRMKVLEDQFPTSPALARIGEQLRAGAAELFKKARAEKNPTNAMRLLKDAESIWPRLPGLRDEFLRRNDAYPVLGVGVRDLPEFLSPGLARTDSEIQAVELLFENLVKPTFDSREGQRYQPVLAEDRPRLIPLGRQFQLTRDAFWSNGERVTAADVRNTVDVLKSRGWYSLLEKPQIGGDAFQVNLTLNRGFVDPLSLMAFKVLPPSVKKLEDARFAREPVGSGPYVYKGREGKEAVFTANPNYRRANKPGMPYIREIHFFHSDDPPADFGLGRLHLLLDLPTERVKAIKTVPNVGDPLTLRNRRIYFLAVNYRNPNLQNQDLRRAVGYAIDRNKILNDFFRADLRDDPQPPHRELNGPYPPGSWAFSDKMKGKSLNAPARAKVLAANVKPPPPLTLKYPNDDESVKKACVEICKQVSDLDTPIKLQPVPVSPRQLHDDVEVTHDYELAYYHFDYPTEAYWLWPLFNTQEEALGPWGSNYLGYKNDGILESLFQQAMNHRDFATLKEVTHRIHETVADRMPFIPLWQLDTHIAVHNDLKPVNLDPLLVFTHVEEWKKKSTRDRD